MPARHLDRNLLIATWNIRAFAGLTEKWSTDEGDSPKRNLLDLHCIAEVVSRFDVVAIQEARGNLTAMRRLLELLGPEWGVIRHRRDEGTARQRRAARVRLRAEAGEAVWPRVRARRARGVALRDRGGRGRQFARTPYAVSFQSARQNFILVTLHVLCGRRADERRGELRAIARWLAEWAADEAPSAKAGACLGASSTPASGIPIPTGFTVRVFRPRAQGSTLRTRSTKGAEPMLAITDTAAEAIKGIVSSQEVPESAGVRIVARPEAQPEGALEVSVAASPAEDDQVVEESGAQVFLEPRAAETLDDKVLDAEVDERGQVTFAVGEQG